MDGEKVSDVSLAQVEANLGQHWSLSFEVAEDAQNVGGLTLFGRGFGNHEQDIIVRVYYLNNNGFEPGENDESVAPEAGPEVGPE